MRLDAAKLAALEERAAALAPVRFGSPRKQPTPEQAEVLRKYFGKVRRADLADVLGVAEKVMLRWAREAGLVQPRA